ncbi:rod shape-determining protein RodA [Gracilimonas mengyeensis]|uniref:Rod shape determining protein RodA n=1 Tax=Gracilimonas mengyeensis TaxID=1302730 RepID=A0A521EQY7_9BACT|nr:rod shape-determining protein RodA [Gracilimonas mengyeensis]SMO86344.1 rod shape determining protein RodA [Gracilimonas mengyeensis]
MSKVQDFSWSVVFAWVILMTFGLVAIYSATLGPVSQYLPGYIQDNFYKQGIFIVISIGVLIAFQFVSPRTFLDLSYLLYGIGILLMIITLLFGAEINGARSWLRFGPFNLQTSELMKIATILAAGNYLTSRRNITAENIRYATVAVIIILIPASLVLLQNDLGTTLIFLTLIPVMLFWSGLPYGVSIFMISPAIIAYLGLINVYYGVVAAIILTAVIFFIQKRVWLTVTSFITGIITIAGVQVALTQILKPHQIARISAFTNPSFDPTGAGWNVIQAKTAIGSGGLTGKGFMEGTQTQLKFLPEQWTDFIFCVIGEEFGFIGASILVLTFLFLFFRLLNIAGSHKHPFAQLVTVSITSVFFVHFFINVGSASALLPVIGLPLPFVSYGGSAFLTNTIMLAICLNMDFYKREFSIYR